MKESRVLSAQDSFVLRALRDFRVMENGREWIARLRGAGKFRSAVFPEKNDGQVLVELIPVSEWERPSLPVRWAHALRLPYLLFSLLPLFLVLTHVRSLGLDLRPLLPITLLLFASLVMIHLGCNLWSDYEDHLRGVDSPEHTGGSRVIQRLWIPAVHLRNAAAVLFFGGCALGLGLLWLLPWSLVGTQLLWIGLLGAFGAASYSGWPFHYKYLGLGEPIVFVLSGPVVTAGAALIYGQTNLAWYALASLPLSFLAVLRLHAGNVQRAPFDTISGVFTVARYLGFRWSKLAYGFLFFAPALTTLALWAAGLVGNPSLLVGVVTLLTAGRSVRPLLDAKGPLDPAFHELKHYAVRLHFSFGLLYSLSFLFP